MFECRLKNAINEAGCVPWDYPMPRSMSLERNKKICNSIYNETVKNSTLSKFHGFMNSGKSIANCECLSDCEEVVYEATVYLNKNACDSYT